MNVRLTPELVDGLWIYLAEVVTGGVVVNSEDATLAGQVEHAIEANRAEDAGPSRRRRRKAQR